MTRKIIKTIICSLFMLSAHLSVGQERDRNKIPDQYKWNLKDIYPSDELWMEKKKALLERIPSIEKFRGTLSQSSTQLASCLRLLSELQKEYGRLYTYSSMISDQDTRSQNI
jgi:oligoendopeptidase F